tara:strand:+ start:37097 stop:37555 length:459 start_codon:yes stop_codon:yes gene_type:complete
MPDAAQSLVDTVIGISATLPTTYDNNVSTGYPARTYVVLGQITDWTPGGKTFNLTTSNPVAQRGTDKLKGSYNNDADTISVNRDDDDVGQVVTLAALASDNDYAFEVIFQDGSEDYFTAKVVSHNTVAGGADAMVQITIQLERTRDTISVAP